MTYGRVHLGNRMHNVEGADVSHWAELVRGTLNGEAVTLLERLLGHVGGGGEG